jgi:CubicO group peptidase (beta-lactamase class C family)
VTTDPLPVSTPAAQGVAAKGIQAFLDALETASGADPHSLIVLRHGCVIVSGWWSPYTPARPHLLYSLSKSFASTAVSFAIADGLLRLDDPVIAYFPELDAEITGARARSVLVRHVAAMASGRVDDTWQRALSAEPKKSGWRHRRKTRPWWRRLVALGAVPKIGVYGQRRCAHR